MGPAGVGSAPYPALSIPGKPKCTKSSIHYYRQPESHLGLSLYGSRDRPAMTCLADGCPPHRMIPRQIVRMEYAQSRSPVSNKEQLQIAADYCNTHSRLQITDHVRPAGSLTVHMHMPCTYVRTWYTCRAFSPAAVVWTPGRLCAAGPPATDVHLHRGCWQVGCGRSVLACNAAM